MRHLFLPLLLVASVTLLPGCPETDTRHMSSGLSLVEIGERSLESAERFQMAGNREAAGKSYRRALWAFSYHQRLTGEEPLLMDDAVMGVRRWEKGGK